MIPGMRKVRSNRKAAGMAALLSTALLLIQLCGAMCAFSACRTAIAESLTVQQRKSGHCHGGDQTQSVSDSQTPQKQSHKCADHETVVILPAKDALATVVASSYLSPIVFETFTRPSFNRAKLDSYSHWDSRRAPPRVPRHSILRV